MLGKLIKHELRGSGRTMLPFILVSLFLAVMAGFSMRAMEFQQDYSWFNILFGIVIFLFVAGLMAVCIMSVVVVINRFRQNLLGDEGYLMFTLPVSVDQHLWAKLIVSAIWFLATALTCMLAVVLVLLCNVRTFDVDWSEVGYVMGELGRMMKEFGIRYRSAGENIAKGYRTVDAVGKGWMNSSGHRDNILSSSYTQLGVGYCTDSAGNGYWVQMFLRQ